MNHAKAPFLLLGITVHTRLNIVKLDFHVVTASKLWVSMPTRMDARIPPLANAVETPTHIPPTPYQAAGLGLPMKHIDGRRD